MARRADDEGRRVVDSFAGLGGFVVAVTSAIRACDRCREVNGDVERVLVSSVTRSRELYWCARCIRRHRAVEPFEVVEVAP